MTEASAVAREVEWEVRRQERAAEVEAEEHRIARLPTLEDKLDAITAAVVGLSNLTGTEDAARVASELLRIMGQETRP